MRLTLNWSVSSECLELLRLFIEADDVLSYALSAWT